MPWYDLIKDPGGGNLNLRASVASLLGPRRISHGRRRVVQVPNANSELVAINKVQGDQALYVEVWLPNQLSALGARVLFDSSGDMGESAVLHTFNLNAGIWVMENYRAVLLPNEQLYAQAISDAAGGIPAGPRTPLVVSSVVF